MFKRIIVCLLAMALVTAAFIPAAFAAGELAETQVLYYASPGRDIRALDPAFCVSSIELFITYAMFNALVRYPPGNEGDLEAIEPDLAEKWDVAQDGKTWTFHLRKGVKFQKGYGELKAEDVKFTFDRLKTENSPWAKDYKQVTEITVLDDYTVRFTLSKVDPFFLTKLTNYHGGFIVSKKAREKLGKTFKTEPVGTGPFQTKEYKPKDRYVLERHDGYWRGKPILEQIIIPFMPSQATSSMALEKGDLHIAQGKQDEMWINTMRKRTKLVIDTKMQLGLASWAHLNMKRKPLDDIRVRKALAYATNRDEVVAYFGASITDPLYGPVPPYAFGALQDKDIPPELRYDYDPAKAKQLLKEAGHPKGITLKMYISEKESYLKPMTIIQEQWRKVGVNIVFETVDHATYHSKIREDLNPVIWYNATRPPIAGIFLRQYFHSAAIVGKKTAITNFSHYGEADADGDGDVKDNNIDRLIDEAAVEMDPAKQKKLYAEAQLQLLRDLPCVSVRLFTMPFAKQPYVDLGYEPKQSMIYLYHITEKTRILKH